MLISALIMTAIMSLTMIVFGYLFSKHPPSEINSVIGYRTPMSSKNEDTWNFAHRYAGKVWFRSGIITGILSLFFIFALQNFKDYDQLILGICYIQIIILMLVIPLTEIALRKTFDKGGIRKNTP
ncbi:SdpI family protein [Clostridium sp. LP20]|uniref:SdpI family protein n=1 Tax=Clostridium sp. LP20 TaxID=3418665 RepID=UPI003EE7B603